MSNHFQRCSLSILLPERKDNPVFLGKSIDHHLSNIEYIHCSQYPHPPMSPNFHVSGTRIYGSQTRLSKIQITVISEPLAVQRPCRDPGAVNAYSTNPPRRYFLIIKRLHPQYIIVHDSTFQSLHQLLRCMNSDRF